MGVSHAILDFVSKNNCLLFLFSSISVISLFLNNARSIDHGSPANRNTSIMFSQSKINGSTSTFKSESKVTILQIKLMSWLPQRVQFLIKEFNYFFEFSKVLDHDFILTKTIGVLKNSKDLVMDKPNNLIYKKYKGLVWLKVV